MRALLTEDGAERVELAAEPEGTAVERKNANARPGVLGQEGWVLRGCGALLYYPKRMDAASPREIRGEKDVAAPVVTVCGSLRGISHS